MLEPQTSASTYYFHLHVFIQPEEADLKPPEDVGGITLVHFDKTVHGNMIINP